MINLIDNLKLKGEWEIRFKDEKGNEVQEAIKGTNIVTKLAYEHIWNYFNAGTYYSHTDYIGTFGVLFNLQKYVAISSNIIPESYNTTTMANTIGIANKVNYIFTPRNGVNGPHRDYEGLIEFTGARRIFRTIGLIASAATTQPNNVSPPNTQDVYAYSLINPIYYQLTLTSKTGNTLVFNSVNNLTFGTNKLNGQYLTNNGGSLSGESIITNNVISNSNTGLTLTVADGSSYIVNNTYYLIVYPVQESNISLALNYRITVDWDNTKGNATDNFKRSFEKRIFGEVDYLDLSYISYAYNYNPNVYSITSSLNLENTHKTNANIIASSNQDLLMHKREYTCDIPIGLITDTVLLGLDREINEPIWYHPIENYKAPLQNQFPYSPTSTKAFYSSTGADLPSGSLKPIIQDNGYDNYFTWGYDIVISQAGLLGTSKYKIKKFSTLGGFDSNAKNSLRAKTTVYPFLARNNNKFVNTQPEVPQGNQIGKVLNWDSIWVLRDVKRLVKGERVSFGVYGFIQLGNDSLSIVYNIKDEVVENFNSSTHSILNGTNIYQIYIDYEYNPNIIYIACANKGLLRLNYVHNGVSSITLIKSCNCLGVQGYPNGNIVILSQQGVFTSADNYTATRGSISNLNLYSVNYITLDTAYTTTIRLVCNGAQENDFDSRLQLWTENGGVIYTYNFGGASWYYRANLNKHFKATMYDPTTGVFLVHYQSEVYYVNNNSFAVIYFTGDTTYNFVTKVTDNVRLGGTYGGSGQYFKDGLFIGNGVYKINAAKDNIEIVKPSVGNIHGNINGCLLYDKNNPQIESTFMLGDNSINRIVSNSLDNNYLIYGWNGSSWQLDNAELLEGKPTHSSTDTLIDNLNIRWEELSPESPYSMSIGEHFTQYINKGILKEDYITNPKYSFYFIMRPTIFYDINITIPSGLTYQLPFVTDDINFWAIATDTTETFRLHDLEISGYGEPIDIINIGSTAPAQGTITLNSSTGGVLTFNALDEGKTLTGKILYTQKFHPTEVRV